MLWPTGPSFVRTSVNTRGDSATMPLAVRCGSCMGTRTVRNAQLPNCWYRVMHAPRLSYLHLQSARCRRVGPRAHPDGLEVRPAICHTRELASWQIPRLLLEKKTSPPG